MASNVSPLRWFLKKSARRGVVSFSRASGTRSARPGTPRVRALTYHRFGALPRDPFCVSRDDFERQMEYLAARKLAVSLDAVLGFVAGKSSLPDQSVLVTVDDGYRSLLEEALPVLRQHGIPAVAFVNPGRIGATALCTDEPGEPAEPWLTVSELTRLAEAGITVGSHSYSHRSLGGLEAVEVRDEAERSKRELEERLGCPVLSFAYPFGTLADFNAATADILRTSGYACAFTSQHGAIVPGLDPYSLPRIKVEGGEGIGMFESLICGRMDAWRIVDRGLWRLQASKRS